MSSCAASKLALAICKHCDDGYGKTWNFEIPYLVGQNVIIKEANIGPVLNLPQGLHESLPLEGPAEAFLVLLVGTHVLALHFTPREKRKWLSRCIIV